MSAKAKYILAKANVKCPPGSTIVKNTECKQACKELGITKIGKIVSGEDCFKRRDGRCKQNGRHGRFAQMVCKTNEKDGKINFEEHIFNLDTFEKELYFHISWL